MSLAFVGKGGKDDGYRQKWIEEVGTYKYYSLLLANFDPVKADEIFNQPADTIAMAVVSQRAYNYQPDSK